MFRRQKGIKIEPGIDYHAARQALTSALTNEGGIHHRNERMYIIQAIKNYMQKAKNSMMVLIRHSMPPEEKILRRAQPLSTQVTTYFLKDDEIHVVKKK